MKIAIPVAQGALCLHFGHCEQFVIFDVDADTRKVNGHQAHTPPAHEPGVLPRWLKELGADLVIAGGMGGRAISIFSANGIRVITGAPSEEPERVVQAYLDGALDAGPNACDH
ncbi:MAG: NifB/NifX family molybdenum-iron cluster-binding protein [Vicinamibacteria bacterium]|nr:NifB/NifX family molybdenum-iron cluster-binding protein [Vicinamibacteria bacterium]